jgi:hypothetical protein
LTRRRDGATQRGLRGTPSGQRDAVMTDLVFILVTLVVFGVLALVVKGAEKL